MSNQQMVIHIVELLFVAIVMYFLLKAISRSREKAKVEAEPPEVTVDLENRLAVTLMERDIAEGTINALALALGVEPVSSKTPDHRNCGCYRCVQEKAIDRIANLLATEQKFQQMGGYNIL